MKKKKELIKDLKSLEEDIRSLPTENKKKIGFALLEKAMFLERQLKNLQEDIDTNGVTIPMQQGDYFITRANPSCNTYNSFLKQYIVIVKQINDMLPKQDGMSDDEIDDEFF